MKFRPTWSEPFARPFGCLSLADSSSSFAEFAAPQETTTRSAASVSVSPSCSTTTPVTAVPASFVSSFTARAFVSSVTFGCSSAGRTADHLGVRLGVEDAGEPVAVGAAHATCCRAGSTRRAGCRTARGTGGSRPRPGRPRAAGCAARARRQGAGYGALASGSVGSSPVAPVHLVELLGLRVVRLELVVGDRPGRRDAVVVAELAEILAPQPVEGGAVDLGRAADEVVDLGLERPSRSRRTRCPGRRSGSRRIRPAPASSAARAGASRRARAGGSASRRERGDGRASRPPRRFR